MRFSKEEKKMWLADWKQSGRSAYAYAKANGINQQTFINWTKSEEEEKQCFVEVPSIRSNGYEMKSMITIPEILIERGDVKIHIPTVIDHCALRAVIEGLGAA